MPMDYVLWSAMTQYAKHMCLLLGVPLQLKHAKLARQLEASTAAEKAASERVQELQEELLDCSSTCRSRMHWLEQAAADAARRTQQLYRCLQNAAPLEVRAMETALPRCRQLYTIDGSFQS